MPAPECKKCGKCCTDTAIDDIREEDLLREPRLKRKVMTVPDMPGRYSLPRPCPFLKHWKAVPGNRGAHTRCAIHKTKPLVCRVFVPGSPLCLLLRGEITKEQAEEMLAAARRV